MMKSTGNLFLSVFWRKCLLFAFLVQNCSISFGQYENHAASGIELKTHYAFLMPHHNHMRILQEQHFPIYQLNFFRKGDFGREWQALYNFPQHGISVVYSPLSSPEYLGYGLGIFPFINFHVYNSKWISCTFFVGAGLGYVQKPFHFAENYKNEAIGSRFNAILSGQADFRYRLSETTEISTGISITHFSNGKAKTPNLGINNCGIYAGLAYNIPRDQPSEKQPFSKDEKKQEFNFFFAGSFKQNYPVGGKNYLYTAYSLNTKRVISPKRKIGAGIDVFYDYSDRAHFQGKGFDKPDMTYIKPALYLLHDFRLSRISIFIHVGTYLYAFEKNQEFGMIYDRVGIQFYLNQFFSTHVALKTHYAKADCIEFALNLSL
jgi:hypothetical protein